MRSREGVGSEPSFKITPTGGETERRKEGEVSDHWWLGNWTGLLSTSWPEERETGRKEWLAELKVALKTGQCNLSQSYQALTTVLRPHTKDKEQEGKEKDKKLR